MHVLVKLSATLRSCVPGYDPEKGLEVDLPNTLTAEELARHIGVPPADVKLVMINSRQKDMKTDVNDGDRIAYFPPVGGG